jgi:hypothetical protein
MYDGAQRPPDPDEDDQSGGQPQAEGQATDYGAEGRLN